jgi:hypothetical protein
MKLSKVNCQYGAPMGRTSSYGSDETIKFRLERMQLIQGYDNGGAYWGEGPPAMWYAKGEDSQLVHEFFTRANNRDKAKELVKERFPKAKFYR